MNLFTTITHPDGTVELITPPLEDMVLPGVTRDSIMSLCAAHNDPSTSFKIEGLPETIKVTERSMTMSEIVAASKDGTLSEMFGSGTAAIVSPVDRIGYVISFERDVFLFFFRSSRLIDLAECIDTKAKISPFLVERMDWGISLESC